MTAYAAFCGCSLGSGAHRDLRSEDLAVSLRSRSDRDDGYRIGGGAAPVSRRVPLLSSAPDGLLRCTLTLARAALVSPHVASGVGAVVEDAPGKGDTRAACARTLS